MKTIKATFLQLDRDFNLKAVHELIGDRATFSEGYDDCLMIHSKLADDIFECTEDLQNVLMAIDNYAEDDEAIEEYNENEEDKKLSIKKKMENYKTIATLKIGKETVEIEFFHAFREEEEFNS